MYYLNLHLLNLFSDKSFTSVFTSDELNYAKVLGYDVICIFECYQYKDKGKIFSDYMKVLASYKLRVSQYMQFTVLIIEFFLKNI